MKSYLKIIAAAAMLPAVSCEALIPEKEMGELRLQFSNAAYLNTRANTEIPDTNDFILTVLDSKGNEVYNGKYGNSPESILVDAGSYTVSAVSSEFKQPKFAAPQYGDRQVVVVSSGKKAYVELVCRQMNAGIKLNIASNFLTAYPRSALLLKSAEGSLPYAYTEKRIAYFNPGNVSLVMSGDGTDRTLLARTLESQEILVLNISAPGEDAGQQSGVSVQVDTTRYWSWENYTIGQEGSSGGGRDDAYSVARARNSPGEEDVWVYGYIVGGDLSSSSASFTPPFKSRTNIVIASRTSTTDKGSCLSVQLQKGEIRDVLNLVDNQDNLGREVFLKGDIVESYYGIPGLQNITEYELK